MTTSKWNSGDQDAFRQFMAILNQFGFKNNGEIANAVKQMVLQGITDINQIELGLRGTDAWQTRFAGNVMRTKNGLNELSVSDYLATESSYEQIMHQAGLPAHFYNDPADFAKFIGNGVSPTELQSRVAIAEDIKNREDPQVMHQLAERGIGHGDYMAFILDPKKGMDVITKKYQSALIGAAAQRAGIGANVAYANKLAGLGITEQQAEQGFGQVASITTPLEQLAAVYGTDYSKKDAEKEIFENNADALKKRQQLTAEERAAFEGSSGTVRGSLTQSATGSY